MGRMLNPAAPTLKNSQGQCSENTVLPVLKIQVKIFLSLKLLKSWSLENLERVGQMGSSITMEWQLTATKAPSNINAAVLSHVVFELLLSQALKWAECCFSKIKDTHNKTFVGTQSSTPGAEATGNCYTSFFSHSEVLLPKEQDSSIPLWSHGCGPPLD